MFRLMTILLVFKLTIHSGVGEGLGIQVSDNPTDSCIQIDNIQRSSSCFYKCLTKFNSAYMCSHNNDNKLCMCCKDSPGVALADPDWTSYMPSPCPEGYTTYNYTYFEICLMYVPINTKYPDAVEHCKQNGGDLIKIDSLEKYTIFKSYSGQYTRNGRTDIWVQGVKDNNQQWRFHDGSLMPGHCLSATGQSGDPIEIHMRAKSDLDFRCYDVPPSNRYHFVCEKYRLFPNFR